MKQWKTTGLFFLLFATWLTLFWVTGSRTPWQIFTPRNQDDGIVVPLGEMAGRNYDRMGFEGGEIRYVPSNEWLVGTANGELRLLSKEGGEKWSHPIGSGLIRSLSLSPDGKRVYVGEKSPDGYLYAMNTSSGDILWKFKGFDVIGGEPDIRADPQTIHISTDREGNIYAVFYRFTITDSGQRGYLSRVVSFTPSGEERWRFPKDHAMDGWVNWGEISQDGSSFAFGTANYDKSKIENLEYNKNIYVLDGRDGTLIHSTVIDTAPHFGSVTMRNGPVWSEGGNYLSTITSDGRAFLFDKEGHILWQRTLAEPKEMNGTWFFAAGRDALFVPEGVIFDTINTFSRDNWQMPSPVIHPSSNSLFFFDLSGTFRWKYSTGGEIEALDAAKGVAALAVGRNVRNHDYKAHGAEAVNLADGSRICRFHTAGPLQNIAISDDGSLMAGIEVPAVTPEGSLLGAYRLHIWKIAEQS